MEYLQFVAFGELAEWADFVDAEGDDLQIGHFLDDLQIFELVAPQVEILDAVEIIAFGFGQHQLHRQSLFSDSYNESTRLTFLKPGFISCPDKFYA